MGGLAGRGRPAVAIMLAWPPSACPNCRLPAGDRVALLRRLRPVESCRPIHGQEPEDEDDFYPANRVLEYPKPNIFGLLQVLGSSQHIRSAISVARDGSPLRPLFHWFSTYRVVYHSTVDYPKQPKPQNDTRMSSIATLRSPHDVNEPSLSNMHGG